MKKIIITGGCGYVGSFVCNMFLKKNFKVFVVDNNTKGNVFINHKNIKYFNFNFGNKNKIINLINANRIENFIHLAAFIDSAESVVKPKIYIKNNFEFTKKILMELPSTTIKRFLFASTAAVYGNSKKNKISEKFSKSPKSPYGISKLKSEIVIEKILKKSQINYTILRLFNVAGANPTSKLGPFNSKYNHIFNKLIRNRKFKIYGTNYNTLDGTTVRDYIHPDDVSESFYKSYRLMLKNNKNEIFNCGSGRAFSVKNILDNFSRYIDYKIEIINEKRRPGDPSYILSNNKKIKKKLNIKFKKSKIKNIILSLISWKRLYIDGISNQSKKIIIKNS